MSLTCWYDLVNRRQFILQFVNDITHLALQGLPLFKRSVFDCFIFSTGSLLKIIVFNAATNRIIAWMKICKGKFTQFLYSNKKAPCTVNIKLQDSLEITESVTTFKTSCLKQTWNMDHGPYSPLFPMLHRHNTPPPFT